MPGTAAGRVRLRGQCLCRPLAPLLRGPFTMRLGLGILSDGLVCQIVMLGIDQKLLNSDYAFGTDGIQQYRER